MNKNFKRFYRMERILENIRTLSVGHIKTSPRRLRECYYVICNDGFKNDNHFYSIDILRSKILSKEYEQN